MSTKYPGGIITKSYTPPTTTSASGIWTLDQQDQAQQAGIWPFGGPFNYIEDVFSTYVYTGTGATQSINNGIDLSTKGGLVWTKSRTNPTGTYDGWHALVDTVRGTNSVIYSNATDSYSALNTYVSAFNSNGFNLGAGTYDSNKSSYTYASWTFRKQAKFFDVVTFTGDGTDNRAISHNLGSVPGCIIVKSLSLGYAWAVKHRSLSSASQYLILNDTAAPATTYNPWSTNPTSSVFYVNGSASSVSNGSGVTYVAYLFAHNAGGFGTSNTDNVISCGSLTTSGTAGLNYVTLGYEPQFVMLKRTNGAENWIILDVMRAMSNTSYAELYPNTSQAESSNATYSDVVPTATGFALNTNTSGTPVTNGDYIYIAIRRGPMKVPTDATKVFAPITFTGSSATRLITGTNFPVDMLMGGQRSASTNPAVVDRLRGATQGLITLSTAAETTSNGTTQDVVGFDYMDGYKQGSPYNLNINSNTALNVLWFFRRAPSFFDEVCYTGTGATDQSIIHNLGVVPNLIITKGRSNASAWRTWASPFTSTSYDCSLQAASPVGANTCYSSTGTPFTTTTYTVNFGINTSGYTFVSYLFATCAGVSKVGSYTGNGTTQAIACGFTGGARFVLIKRTDDVGDWYVYDTARGMTTLTDPYLLLNNSASETATLGSVTTTTGGFTVNASILSAINTSAASYLFLAIA